MKIFFAFVILAAGQMTGAAESLSTKVSGQYSSIRALGMGNAFTALADDYTLIFYNPAGFAKKKNNEIQVTFAGAGVAPKTLTFADDIKMASATVGTEPAKANAVSAVIEQYYGKSLGGKVQALEMFWIRKNWGVALVPLDLTIDMSMNRQLGPAIDLNAKADTILAYGYGTELNKFWSVGASAKVTHRVAFEQSVAALELASDPTILNPKRAKEGNNIDFDIGALWTPNWFNKNDVQAKAVDEEKELEKVKDALPLEEDKRTPQAETPGEENPAAKMADQAAATTPVKIKPIPTTATPEVKAEATPEVKAEVKPTVKSAGKKKKQITTIAKADEKPEVKERFPLTFGIVMKNVLGGSFSKSAVVNKDATEVPKNIPRVIDVGVQYSAATIGNLEIRTMLDGKNLLHPNANLTNTLHAGVEFDYSPSGWFKSQIRAGMNQLYYTAGATLLLGVINIDVASYGEEVGTSTTKIENRVYAFKLGMNF